MRESSRARSVRLHQDVDVDRERPELACRRCGYRISAGQPPTLCPMCRHSIRRGDPSLQREDQILRAEHEEGAEFDPLELVSRHESSFGEALRGVPFS